MKPEEALKHVRAMPERIPHHILNDNGVFPNSRLPVLHYPQVLNLPSYGPRIVEAIFSHNGWRNSWRNGIYRYHHYHSTSHEVLGIYAGHCLVQLGGDKGIDIELKCGDVLILPAGVAHRCLSASQQFRCLGAYPEGRDYDLNIGKPGERPQVDRTIAELPIPTLDPVYGQVGLLLKWWQQKEVAG